MKKLNQTKAKKQLSNKKLQRQINRRARKRINFQTNQRADYNIKNGDIYQRIHYLLNLACNLYKDNKNLSKMYISIMKDIIKKNAMRSDSKFKKLICSQCNNLIFIDAKTNIQLTGKAVL